MKKKIISLCSEHSTFAEQIANRLKISLARVDSQSFNNGEVLAYPLETVRGCDVFIIYQINGENINDALFRIMILTDALHRASAGRVTLIMPFLPYLRQDYRSKHRQPISARLLAKLLKAAGVNNLVTFDMHAKQSEGFFDMPVDNIGFTTLLSSYLKQENKDIKNLLISTADVGGVERVKKLADKIGCEFVLIYKTRQKAGVVGSMTLLGDVTDRDVILFDDMTDTGGTLINAANVLKEKGAKSVTCGVTHLFNNTRLIQKLDESCLDQIFMTDSIYHGSLPSKFQAISLTPMIAKIITNINDGTSADID